MRLTLTVVYSLGPIYPSIVSKLLTVYITSSPRNRKDGAFDEILKRGWAESLSDFMKLSTS